MKATCKILSYLGIYLTVGFMGLSSARADSAIPEAGTDLELAVPFKDNAVLQRGKPVNVWGRSVAGDEVTVAFAEQSKSAVADEQGNWLLQLDAMDAQTTPGVLAAKSKATGKEIQVRNVVVGDVWLCSGQSNMQWSLMNTTTGAEEMASADYPLIRCFTLSANAAEQPAFEVPRGSWIVAQSKTTEALDSPIRHFSGVAYHFAKKVFEETGVPIGFIQPSFGGTMIEAWLGEAALASSPHSEKIQERWNKLLESIPAKVEEFEKAMAEWEKKIAAGEKPEGRKPQDPRGIATQRHRPAALYNGMIAPFIPYGITGFLWYQGESNAERPEEYADLFPRLLSQFRTDFGNHPFYFVQLANFDKVRADASGRRWAFLREAQSALLSHPNTGMAVTIDVGDPDDVHPQNKAAVGQRLALQALKNLHAKDVVPDGPRFESATPENGAIRVTFKGSPTLDLREAEAPRAFEIAGEDGVFHPARASVDGTALVIRSDKVPTPTTVRYAWFNNPTAVLFGSDGLPAAPFRSDHEL